LPSFSKKFLKGLAHDKRQMTSDPCSRLKFLNSTVCTNSTGFPSLIVPYVPHLHLIQMVWTPAELLRRGVKRPPELKKPFSNKDIKRMRSLDIPSVTSNLDCLERIQAQIEEMNRQLLDEFKRRLDAQLIATIPGIGYYSALLIHAEIDDINRFPDPESLAAYAGLVPTVSQSASSVHYGGISKEGSAYLRWVLTEAVHSHKYLHAGSNLAKFHSRIEKRRGKNKATIAAARKLAHIIYWMLRTREPYHSQGFNPVPKPARTSA